MTGGGHAINDHRRITAENDCAARACDMNAHPDYPFAMGVSGSGTGSAYQADRP